MSADKPVPYLDPRNVGTLRKEYVVPIARHVPKDSVTRAVQQTVEGATNFIADAARLQAIKDLLSKSPTGAAALDLVAVTKVKIVFATNGGESYWDGRGRIVIERSQSVEDAALSLVHEVHHAGLTWLGADPDPKTQSVHEYVRDHLEAEAQSRAAAYTTRNELSKADPGLSFRVDAVSAAYDVAHGQAVRAAQAAGIPIDPETVEAAARKAGVDSVVDILRRGKAMSNGDTYEEYFERIWRHEQPRPWRSTGR